jgi:hypothetical protein
MKDNEPDCTYRCVHVQSVCVCVCVQCVIRVYTLSCTHRQVEVGFHSFTGAVCSPMKVVGIAVAPIKNRDLVE